jgi:hypothetical protein
MACGAPNQCMYKGSAELVDTCAVAKRFDPWAEERVGRELVVRHVGRPRIAHGLAAGASSPGGKLSD